MLRRGRAYAQLGQAQDKENVKTIENKNQQHEKTPNSFDCFHQALSDFKRAALLLKPSSADLDVLSETEALKSGKNDLDRKTKEYKAILQDIQMIEKVLQSLEQKGKIETYTEKKNLADTSREVVSVDSE